MRATVDRGCPPQSLELPATHVAACVSCQSRSSVSRQQPAAEQPAGSEGRMAKRAVRHTLSGQTRIMSIKSKATSSDLLDGKGSSRHLLQTSVETSSECKLLSCILLLLSYPAAFLTLLTHHRPLQLGSVWSSVNSSNRTSSRSGSSSCSAIQRPSFISRSVFALLAVVRNSLCPDHCRSSEQTWLGSAASESDQQSLQHPRTNPLHSFATHLSTRHQLLIAT